MTVAMERTIIFLGGAIVGGSAMYLYQRFKDRKQDENKVNLTDEEIAYVENDIKTLNALYQDFEKILSNTHKDSSTNDLVETTNEEVTDDYKSIMDYYNEHIESENDPVIISPEEFGDNPEYEVISLTYYSDGVIADQSNVSMDNSDYYLGPDIISHFGEYEDDSVFVRNDRLKTYYEILFDSREYKDILEDRPYLSEM